jgi:hypothetical protein
MGSRARCRRKLGESRERRLTSGADIMLVALRVISATVVGTIVGVKFALAVFVNARADRARVLGRLMPFWYVGSLILTAGLARQPTAPEHSVMSG